MSSELPPSLYMEPIRNKKYIFNEYRRYFIMAMAIILAGVCVWFFVVSKQSNNKDEVAMLVAKISKFLVLPEDEQPTVATVSDPGLLKDQQFFAKAQKGDKVLIYAKAKKAILYNPLTNKIVEIAPINLGKQPAAAPTQ